MKRKVRIESTDRRGRKPLPLFKSPIIGRLVALILLGLPRFALTLAQTPAPDDFAPGEVRGQVESLAVQEDGKILVGGGFRIFGTHSRSGLARLHPDGDVDTSFQTNNFTSSALLLLPDGRIIAGAIYDAPRTPPRWGVERLATNGVPDPEFFAEADRTVTALALQADGQILVGGFFQMLRGLPRSLIGRLNSNGSVDQGFHPDLRSLLTDVTCLALQPDRKILVAGRFSQPGQPTVARLVRLHPDGSPDNDFVAPTAVANNKGYAAVTVQPDGRIVVGGNFRWSNPTSYLYLARLLPDGSPDKQFQPQISYSVATIAPQSDGQLLIGGMFTMVGTQGRYGVARLKPDGQLDPDFNTGVTGGIPEVLALALQADGRLLVGGRFEKLGGQARSCLGRLEALPQADDTLRQEEAGTLTWQRSGASPEVVHTLFESSSNGTDWSELGAGTRVPGGWRLSGVSIPTGATLRVRGQVVSAQGRSTGWSVTAYAGRLILLSQPEDQNLSAGETARFSARAGGDGTLHYQWFKDGAPLTNSVTLSGAETPFLRVASVIATDAGHYSAIIQNDSGSVTSRVATLRIADPRVVTQPADAEKDTGQSLTLTVTAAGTSPLTFQWWKDDSPLPGRTAEQLAMESVIPPDGGRYWVVVSNQLGSVTSRVAVVKVWDPRITLEPESLARKYGQQAKFEVAAVGTAPLTYQWWKDDVPLANADLPTLDLGLVSGGHDGSYRAVVHSSWGSVTSRVAQLTVEDPVITNPPTSVRREPGQTLQLTVTAEGTPPIAYQWWKDGVVLPGMTMPVLRIEELEGADAGHYSVVASNQHGSATSAVGEVTVDLTRWDTVFDPQAYGDVYGLAIYPEGKVAAGGLFTDGQGIAFGTSVIRFDSKGQREKGFGSLGQRNGFCLAVEPSGNLLVGGASLNSGGFLMQLDEEGQRADILAQQPNLLYAVRALALQSDGKTLLGGQFDSVLGVARSNLARLNPDWTLDRSFSPPPVEGMVHTLAVQKDGRVLIGGDFAAVAGQPRSGLARLERNGELDNAFNPDIARTNAQSGRLWVAYCLVVQSDGRILVGGWFGLASGQSYHSVARLNPDGSQDAGAQPQFAGQIISLAPQADGKVIAGGYFEFVNGFPRKYIARIHADGRLDSNFDPGSRLPVTALALQADGQLLAGGHHSALARLINSDPAMQSLQHQSRTLTWLRGGAGPEVFRTTFERSLDGAQWELLGEGERVPGGWRLGDVTVNLSNFIRARGYTTGGNRNASCYFVETRLIVGQPQPPVIHQQPENQSIEVGGHATLAVEASGTEPLTYQWYVGASGVTDFPLAGATEPTFRTPALTVTTSYWVRVSNTSGTADSRSALITVPPVAEVLALHAVELRDDRLRLLITGSAGSRCQLQYSTNLLVWQPVAETGTIELANGRWLAELTMSEGATRFFRVSREP